MAGGESYAGSLDYPIQEIIMSQHHKVKTVGDLRKLLASLPDDTKIGLDWHGHDGYVTFLQSAIEISIRDMKNSYDGCVVCSDARYHSKKKGLPDCQEHSGKYLVLDV